MLGFVELSALHVCTHNMKEEEGAPRPLGQGLQSQPQPRLRVVLVELF